MHKRLSGISSRWASFGTIAALALTASAVGMAPAQSATSATVDTNLCPQPYPVSQVTKGLAVTGLTVDGVDSGTQPTTFTGTVLGVLKDGIAPGVDMIMVKLSSPTIDQVGGIWEGMSGSPVYTADHQLVGAVAYGLSAGPTPIAGVTPAADMEALLDSSSGGSVAPAARVAVPDRMARTVAARTTVTRTQLSDGFTQLRIPFGVSGLSGTTRLRQARKLLGMRGVRLMQTGAAGTNTDPTAIVPGGNVAASISYGDVTAAGVGTVTAVCGNEVLAFGHPMNDTGPSTLTLHGADALYIQPDPYAPFKVANISGPAGTIDQDRLAGLHGELGATPATTTVTSYVESAGRERTGTTWISVPEAVPDLATMHLLADQDRIFDGVGKGSGTVSWTIRGERHDGSPFALSHTDMYADSSDLSSAIAFSLDDTLSTLVHNGTQQITIDSVHTSSVLNRSYDRYRIGTVQLRWAGQWMPASPRSIVPVRADRLLRLRVLLKSSTLPARWVRVTVHVPHRATGRLGTLTVFGGDSGVAGPGPLGPPVGPGMRSAQDFDAVLQQLRRAPHHNVVVARLSMARRGAPAVKRRSATTVAHVVDGGINLQVEGIR